MDVFEYQSGFGGHFETEALAGALPVGRNSPQKPPKGLYPEQLSGSAFTAKRERNLRTWLYRILPSVVQGTFERQLAHPLEVRLGQKFHALPDPMRWSPMPRKNGVDFFESLFPMVRSGLVGQAGMTAYLYSFDVAPENRFFYSADGEFLFIPQDGALELRTEMGRLRLGPEEVAVIPRGVKFQVVPLDGVAQGYLAENFGEPFQLPYLGPIGSNGLAQPRDFLYPVAHYVDQDGEFELYTKFHDQVFLSSLTYNPLNVVAWHGNLAPYKYDLRRFNTIGTVSFDHPDPSIFTVLTSPSSVEGVADVDFVIFPPRWMVGEDTFRPPYYHRNYMNEFMGLIRGVYDAKAEGFLPGGASLHNRMTGHGPDRETFEKASKTSLSPEKIEATMAFMLETCEVLRVSGGALGAEFRDPSYSSCWQDLGKNFK